MAGEIGPIEFELAVGPRWVLYVVGFLINAGLHPVAEMLIARMISVRRIR